MTSPRRRRRGASCVRSDWREREKVIRPDLLELAGAPQRHHARRGGPGPGNAASRAAWSASTASRASAGTGVYPQETRLLPIVARPPLAERERRRGDPQHADLEPGRRADDPAEPGHVRRRGRLGRPGRDAPRPLPDAHRPRRPAVRPAQPAVQPRAVEDRADRAAAGLFVRSGAASTRTPATPAPPWPSRSRTCWRSWCSSSSACSTRSAPRC